MVKLSCIFHKKLCYPHLFMVLIFVFSAFDRAEAIRVTIDAGDPTASYQSLDAFFAKLDAMNTDSVPDTVLFKGSKQYTYTASQYVINAKSSKKMYFLSTATNPDSFPIINHTIQPFYDFFAKTPTSFERLIFTGILPFHNGNSANDLIFSQCVIRNNKGLFLRIAGDKSPTARFSNCLFVNNADTIFQTAFWGGSPKLEITNCTFDNNNIIFDLDQPNNSNFVFKNNIFTNNKSTFPGPLLRAKTTYSITSEPLANYGIGCYQLLPADSAALYKFNPRTNDTIPSHWKLSSTSKAGEFLKTAAVLNVDIAGTSRGVASLSDVGCWKFDNGLKIVTQPKSDTVVISAVDSFTVGASLLTGVTYKWYKKGSTTILDSTDSYVYTAISTLDSARFYCVVSNVGGSVTSDTVTLRVMNKPVILKDSAQGISILNGDSASFKISATGFKLSYHWHLGTSILKTDTLKPYCKIDTIKREHDNALLYCEVVNPAGPTKSLVDTLHVQKNLVISTQPLNATVYQGQTATFSIVANGNGPLLYSWYQTDSAETKRTKLASTNTLTLPNVLLASNNSSYYCVVYMLGDSTKSNLAFLKVNAIGVPKITEQSPSLETTVGNNVSLYVTVDGIVDSVKWYKDGSLISGANSKVYPISGEVMKVAGTYAYRCIVKNTSGSDSSKIINVTINKKGYIYNPIVLKGKFVNRSSIRLTIKNFLSLPVKNDTLPYADRIGVWYKNSTFAPTPDTLKTMLKISLDSLRAKGVNDSFDVLVNIPMGEAECDSICFIATPFWKPDSLPPFKIDNGTKVYSCGSKSIQNPLTLKITQLQDSVVTLDIDGFSSLNKNDFMKIITYYGNPGSYIYDTIKNFPVADKFINNYKNVLFAGLAHTISWGVYIRGIEGNYSDTNVKQFDVGYSQPLNVASLKVDSSQATLVLLKWNAPIVPERIRIWYGKDIIPLFTDTKFPSSGHDSISVPGTQDTIRISGLHENTKYYFGLQLQKNGIWSGITESATCYTTTTNLDPGKINNTIKITDAHFDTLTHKFMIKFTFDSTGSKQKIFNVGYTYNKTGYNNNKVFDGQAQRITNFIPDDSTNKIEIDLGNNLDFDTTYYISLWAQSLNASWSEPTDSSRHKVNTPSLSWMEVSLFNANDSIFTTFEGKVQFEKMRPDWYQYPWDGLKLKDKLDLYNLDRSKIPIGFKVVSIAVKFRDPKTNLVSPESRFGIKIDSLLLNETKLKDVNMYAYDTSTGNFKIIYTRDADDSDGVISVRLKLETCTSPLILMVDTLKPVVSVSDTASVLTEGTDLTYTIKVKDNVSNAFAIVKYGAGADALTTADTLNVADVSDALIKIPSSKISANSGLRVLLIVTDGHFVDTVNLSRVVSTTTDLVLKTAEMKWFPLCVHYELNSVEVKQLFDSLSGPEKKYDNTKFRLVKWYDSLEYKTEVGKYVEYNMVTENDTLFDLKPGNLLWLKTRKPTSLNFGKVKTLSLKKSYSVTLPPNTWTDVAVPFEYAIKIFDILADSGIVSDKNKLVINQWQTTAISKTYTSNSIHDPFGETHPESEMSGVNNYVYSIYNWAKDPNDTVILKFPPIPSSMSKYVPSVKKLATSDWRFTIMATTEGEGLNPIYCAFTNEGLKKTLIPVAPSFGSLRMGVVENGNLYGIAVAHEKAEGYAYNLKFENKEVGKQAIHCSIVENVASGMNMKLFDPITGTTEEVTAGFTVDVDGQSSAQRWLLVGNDAFVGKFIQKNVEFSLLQLYPNPFRGVLNIKFMIPLAGVNSVNCMLFDPLGRRVWDFKIDKQLHSGLNLFAWQPGQGAIKRLASGTYFFKLVAKDEHGKITGSKLAKLMYFTD